VVGRHPWVFAGAIARVEGPAPEDGAEVLLMDSAGVPVARGLWNGRSQIRVRVYGWDPETPLDRAFFEARVDRALESRAGLPGLPEGAPALRLIFSESDGLSGLTVDRFGEWLVVQFTSLALHARADFLLDHLEVRLRPRGILLRTEKGIGETEGLEIRDGLVRGSLPEEPVPVNDGALEFRADLREGQKTGFYLDQRENRRAAARYAEGRRAADVCCYSGGFSLHLALGGATHVTGVDASASALALAERNAEANGLSPQMTWVKSDALSWLRGEAEAGQRYGLVVLDPPRFARSRKGVEHALLGYRRLNQAAVEILEPGGILVTCSCSGRVGREAFEGVFQRVSEETGRRLRLLENRGQPGDHPVDPACPETAYLKCLIFQVE
jgi:23S rRNA (cytosine1962-C5)-methyltransferase